MTEEELYEIFDQDPERGYNYSVFEILQILRKYNIKADIGCAEHDIVYFDNSVEDYLEEGLTKEDAIALRNRGCIIEDESFCSFV